MVQVGLVRGWLWPPSPDGYPHALADRFLEVPATGLPAFLAAPPPLALATAGNARRLPEGASGCLGQSLLDIARPLRLWRALVPVAATHGYGRN